MSWLCIKEEAVLDRGYCQIVTGVITSGHCFELYLSLVFLFLFMCRQASHIGG